MAEEDWDFEGTHNFEIIESWMEIDGPLEVKDVTEDYTQKIKHVSTNIKINLYLTISES